MYILELIAKFVKKRRMKNQFSLEPGSEEDYEDCDHIYLPIDSTKDYLACNKCGHVIKNTQKNVKKNIFEEKNIFK